MYKMLIVTALLASLFMVSACGKDDDTPPYQCLVNNDGGWELSVGGLLMNTYGTQAECTNALNALLVEGD